MKPNVDGNRLLRLPEGLTFYQGPVPNLQILVVDSTNWFNADCSMALANYLGTGGWTFPEPTRLRHFFSGLGSCNTKPPTH